ncbi:Uncharacterized conserved protein, DUF885 familyt [Goodfellowiella coeruleoviolacea]|uniref:Uncharacterized conserved protein, DUF885 familyt n=1 Tax=Goodfellowiella coeruleoviolacea TaxID=334858 RepID=A0AAE3GL42_9PSEU|nr:Uncharacterized conserved protein, DUF885 familyt [Goodfellowiella coeruleoviolacea]
MSGFLDWYLDSHPAVATALGSLAHDHTLGDFSATGFTAREQAAAQWLTRLDAAATDGVDPADVVDRDLLVAVLRGERAMAGWPEWRRDPVVYLRPVFTTLFNAFLHRLRPEPELVASAEARLAEVPGVLAECRRNLDPDLAAPLLVRRALDQARTARGFLTRTLPAEVADERLRARLAAAAEPAAEAFDELVGFLTDFATRARGDWRMGERLYSTLLTERELLGYDAAELHRRGVAAYEELDQRMRELAARLPRTSDREPTDWHRAMADLQDDHPPTLEAMRAEYAATAERARAFLVEHGLVTLAEGEQCRVVPAPVFQRPMLAVPAYLAPPPLAPASRVGHFFVPYPPDGHTEEQVRARLRGNSRSQLVTIAVHEAYPGHHWHLSWLAGNPRTVRKVFRTPYFSEGWALYAEQLLAEHGFFTDLGQQLGHLEARIFRAARIVVDTALHCGDMTVEQAEAHMSGKASLPPETAAAEVSRYCAWPTQAPAYLTGALEINQIRADYLAANAGSRAPGGDRGGNAVLRSFHDTIAGSGALPLGLARRVALGS